MSDPRVSVILPTLNRSELLRRSITSVLQQSYRDLELIVVDDGSSEDIAALVASFDDPRARVIRHEQCRGPGAARATGLAAARGDYLAFQDSDDEWLLNKLDDQVRELDACGTQVGAVFCGWIRYCLDERVWVYPYPQLRKLIATDMRSAVRFHDKWFTQTWLVRRDVFERIGGFDAALQIWDDWDAMLRLSQVCEIRYCDAYQVVSYVTPGSVTDNLPRRIASIETLIQRHQDSGDRALLGRLHYMLARYRIIDGQYSAAWRALLPALRTTPASPKVWFTAGMLLLGLRPMQYIWREPGAGGKDS